MGAIVPASREWARQVAQNLRTLDCQEIRETMKLSPEADVMRALDRSTHAWAGVIGDRAVCLFGLMAPSLTSARATAWLFTTPEIDRHPITFWRGSKEMVRVMRALYPTIEGLCDARFAASVRWLKRLGFDLSPEPHVIAGVPFIIFKAGAHG